MLIIRLAAHAVGSLAGQNIVAAHIIVCVRCVKVITQHHESSLIKNTLRHPFHVGNSLQICTSLRVNDGQKGRSGIGQIKFRDTHQLICAPLGHTMEYILRCMTKQIINHS